MWFDQGRYIGSLPPGALKDGERLTQQAIRKRIKEVGFQDPLFTLASIPGPTTSSMSTSNTQLFHNWRVL